MSVPRPNVFTIPSHVPFLDALAEGLIAQHFDPKEPASLAGATVLLPTRRAARSLGEHLLRHAGARALILPEIRPLGDVDEEALLLADTQSNATVPDALPPLRRRLLLMRLVQAWSDARADHLSAAQCFHLAAELERLIDRADTQGAGLDRLGEIVPAELSRHWSEVLAFLEIVARQWPAIEAAADAIGPAKRRALLMEALREDWTRHPPQGPVIAAGSTGTIPATAALLKTVAHLPQGAVILPGLDGDLAENAWHEVDQSHPQGAMKALLATIGIAREEVQIWPYGAPAAPPIRVRMLNEALRPWRATEGWRDVVQSLRPEIGGDPSPHPSPQRGEGWGKGALALHRIEAAHQGEEAKAIALILREALETPERIAALVTPDRSLARAVQAELKRWDVDVDDTAGLPLAQTGPGVFMRLLARAAAGALAPVPLLGFLKHPLTHLGYEASMLRRNVGALDRVLRGLRPAPGMAGLIERVEECDRLWLKPFLARLEAALAPLLPLFESREPISFAGLLDAHLTAAEAAAGADRLWQGEAGETLARLLQEMLAEGESAPIRPSTEYPDFFEALLSDTVVRPALGRHPRILLWGPLEARLQKADTLVLGGLNEGVWPAEPTGDPWMSRGMMAAAGLPAPEQRLGLSAHDFVQSASGARTVYLTRAIKADGAPTVASRWLVRLETLLGGMGLTESLSSPIPWLAHARALDKPEHAPGPVEPPWPTPPREARPRRLSVTEIERWVRDPYSIYARHVLALKPLDPLDAEAGAALRGQIIHKIAEVFIRPDFDPSDETALAQLLDKGREVFDAHRVPEDIHALWWPRFAATARWLLAQERDLRAAGERILAVESAGEIVIAAAGGPFTLRGRADRIDRTAQGMLVISDYKTGQPPTEKAMRAGLAPQLPLEAMMAREGAFPDLPAAPVSALRVIRLMGTAEPGKLTAIADAQGLARSVEAELLQLIARYDDPAYPYRARPLPKFARDDGPYDHLARVKEWSAGETGEDEA